MVLRGDTIVSVRAAAVLALTVVATLGVARTTSAPRVPPSAVALVRVPDQGIQPHLAVDAGGIAHVVYFKGEPGDGDLFYVRLGVRVGKDGRTLAPAMRVNSVPGSAIATGTVRGAHIAVGRSGRVHVSWNGSSPATPRGPAGATPMLYTRMNAAGTGFEPQRNLIQSAVGLDGGGAIAADSAGRVFVAWHAGGPDSKGEGDRRVWITRSLDDGRTFSREESVSDPATGACGCCGMAAHISRTGALHLLYRSARDVVHRDTYLVTVGGAATKATSTRLEEWNIGACPMSTFALAEAGTDLLAAWETAGQVQFARVDSRTGQASASIAAPGDNRKRKHPAIAVNGRGEVLLAWAEGTGWQRGGSLVWQVFDRNGQPTADRGRADGVGVWSLAAAYARPDGTFVIVY